MEFNRSNRNKNHKRTWIVLSIIGSIVILAAVGWIGYNDWNFQQSVNRLASVAGPQQNKGDEEMIPTGGDPTETEKVPEQNQPVDPVTTPEEDPPSSGEQPDSTTPPAQEEKPETEKPNTDKPSGSKPSESTPKTGTGGYIEGMKLPKEPTYVKGILVANKKHPLPSDFAPGESKEAREAFEKMAAEAKLSGFELVAFSTYRSFDYQTTLYNRYVSRDGQEAADRYSARPGYSEHQTGLAFDIGEKNFEKYWASSKFGDTPAGKWMAENAYKYGFILRYPEGKEEVTGYMHESWHFRYVGEGIAKEIYTNNLTLEEYLNRK